MIPADLSLEDRRLFWRNYDKWCAMFSAAEVNEQLMTLSVMDIVDELRAPLRNWAGKALTARAPTWQMHRKLGTEHTHYTFRQEGWERTERVPCDIYMVPAQYQSTKHEDIIRPIMMARYPWLAEFKCDFYSMNFYDNGGVEEFYVRTAQDHAGHRRLYVPYAAFMAHDIAAIEQRNADYFRSYTKDNAVWNSMKDDANVVAFLLKV